MLAPAAAEAATLLLNAQQFEYPGTWQKERAFMAAGPSARMPMVRAASLPSAGKWRLWVRSKDFPDDRPGTRFFRVRLGNTTASAVFGKHGKRANDGWAWEDGGVFDLPAGPLLVVVGENSQPFARCEALLLSDNPGFVPQESAEWKRFSPAPRVPVAIRSLSDENGLLPPHVLGVDDQVAVLKNSSVTIAFHRARTARGSAVVVRATSGSETISSEAESYRVLYRPTDKPPAMTFGAQPSWDVNLGPVAEGSAGGATVRMGAGPATAPWMSGMCFAIRPIAARQVNQSTVELDFEPLPQGRLHARWRLPAGEPDARVELSFTPSVAGHVSLGYHGSVSEPVGGLDFVLLPPMYHGRRLPPQAMLLSALTSAPMALVNRHGVSYSLIAEPTELTQDWLTSKNSKFALGMKNENGDAQPMLYSPVMGQAGSQVAKSATVTARFRVNIQRGSWYDAYKHVAQDIYRVKDHRRAVNGSLSDAALNLFDLIKSGAGWDERAKGPWNIETRNTVTHSSPLAYLSFYLLTGDSEFYDKFARPAMEYTLSRATPHFAAVSPHGGYYFDDPLGGGPARIYGATVMASAFEMMQGRTGAFGELAATGETARATIGNVHSKPFADSLALYRLTGEKKWLDQAIAGADSYIAANMKKLPTDDLGVQPFVNVSFVPDWEDLLHLYEATGEKRFLDAAAEGARWLLTTIFMHPLTPDGNRTIHPGGQLVQPDRVWFLGDKRFRLGLYDEPAFSTEGVIKQPPAKLAQQSVPAWQVESAGLGLEQPVTYSRSGNQANIFMSIWAPNLLRLAALTGDDLFRTVARNATIGRFTNYPGYYVDDFTNQYQKPDYPVKGPDVTWLYYHHIPTFAAYVLDYLFTDAEVRSAGKIRFPSTRQNGYVWFDSRLFGHAPGTVYGRKAWPWLHRTAITVDNIQVDRVLAHNENEFFAVLLNQTSERQTVNVRFDPIALGKSMDTGVLKIWRKDGTTESLTLEKGVARLELPPAGIATLMVEGTRIKVATHNQEGPARLSLPTTPKIERQRVQNANYDAVGTVISAPPFITRHLYVYLASPAYGCTGAKLTYKVGGQPEREALVNRYPCEFSISLPDSSEPILWRASVLP